MASPKNSTLQEVNPVGLGNSPNPTQKIGLDWDIGWIKISKMKTH
jgi:hypothetical protein